MIDIHCHILFGLDDGSDSLEESVSMAELAKKSGTDVIVATPHTNVPGSYQNHMSREIIDRFNLLKRTLEQRKIGVTLLPGQEIFYNGRVNDMLKDGRLITLNNTRYPLVEFDFNAHSFDVFSKLEILIAEGYVPIVAHPERYRFMAESEEAVYRIKNLGCLLQVNKGSIAGSFGKTAHMVSKRLLEERLADFVASDAHSPYMRTTFMADAHELICEQYSEDYADFLFEVNPATALKDKKVYSY